MLPTITVSWSRSAVTSQYQPLSRGDSQDTNRNYRQGNDKDIYFVIDVIYTFSSPVIHYSLYRAVRIFVFLS